MSHDLAGRPSLGTLDAPAQAACGVSSLQAQENWMGRKRFEQCAGYLVQAARAACAKRVTGGVTGDRVGPGDRFV